uniref:Uncharacterized protein n=1 Tax=Percolomonas cosmopolitus TaxID=63605 RepID=A0A7S1PFQ3_9EUKA|mmetsp:Transcript_1192/g.4105  ORF Transcript_1192/g.4105 Transcript_1192/m.4105 type:complete len:453 (+) Transcript_1192:227-1585(+)
MDENTTIKLVTLILLLISSFFATLIPSVLKKLSSFSCSKSNRPQDKGSWTLTAIVEWLLHVSQGFAAGVLLAGGVAHLLAEYTEQLSEALEKVEGLDDKWKDFPFGESVFICAMIFLYLLEQISHEVLARLLAKRAKNKSAAHHHSAQTRVRASSHINEHADAIVEDNFAENGALHSSPRNAKHRVKGTDVLSPAQPAATESQPLIKANKDHLAANTTYYALGSNSVNVTESDSEDAPTWIVHEKILDYNDDESDGEHVHHEHGGRGSSGHSHMPTDLSQLEHQTFVKTVVSCFVLWVSLVSHSFIEGLGLGLQQDAHHFMSLLVAILSHKLFAAYSLGVVLSSTLSHSRSIFTYGVLGFLIVTFSVVTPSGIAVGILLSDSNFSDELWFQISSSLLLCCAAGAFVYISLFELLMESNNNHGKYGNRLLTSVAFHATFLFGLFGMIVLALWA